MAKDKKSFMLYIDQMGTFNKLTDEQAGKLIKHIFKYCNDEEPESDFVTELAFESIKQALKRDLKKYENICSRNSSNGSKGGRPKKPKEPSGLLGNPEKPKKADSDSDSDRDRDIKQKAFVSFWNTYPKKVQKNGCKDKFLKLKQSEIDIILNTLDNFISYKPFKDYTHPNPMTYLNQKRWNDEIGEVTKTEYSKFKRLHLTQVGTIRSQCREKPLLDILLKRCDCTAEEIHKYILFREANNYLNTYEV